MKCFGISAIAITIMDLFIIIIIINIIIIIIIIIVIIISISISSHLIGLLLKMFFLYKRKFIKLNIQITLKHRKKYINDKIEKDINKCRHVD